MSSEFSDPSRLPPSDLQAEPTDRITQSSNEQEETDSSRLASASRSPLNLHHLAPLVAPDIGEPPAVLIASDPSPKQNGTAAPTKTQPGAVMSRFWLTLLSIAVLLLVAISDWRAKDGPRLPFPNTSRIPQVR